MRRSADPRRRRWTSKRQLRRIGCANGPNSALPVYFHAGKCEGVDSVPIVPAAPASHDRMWARLQSIVWRVEEGTLGPAVLIAIPSPETTLQAALAAAGASGTDLAALPVLALPTYALAPAYRAEIERHLPVR